MTGGLKLSYSLSAKSPAHYNSNLFIQMLEHTYPMHFLYQVERQVSANRRRS